MRVRSCIATPIQSGHRQQVKSHLIQDLILPVPPTVDVHIPTTDGRELVPPRYTQPEVEHRMLLEQLKLTLPEQPPPKITAKEIRTATAATAL